MCNINIYFIHPHVPNIYLCIGLAVILIPPLYVHFIQCGDDRQANELPYCVRIMYAQNL